MKSRAVSIFNGHIYQIPEWIQRIDTKDTHGWQLRYGAETEGTKMFSDRTKDGSGAAKALDLAVAELHRRIERLPASNRLRIKALASKSTDLPLGISGPTLRNANHPSKTAYYCYQISVPKAGGGSTTSSVYIGTENTYDEKKAEAALAKAVILREVAVKAYELAATGARRLASKEMLANAAGDSDA